jgi:hypothetical protein
MNELFPGKISVVMIKEQYEKDPEIMEVAREGRYTDLFLGGHCGKH